MEKRMEPLSVSTREGRIWIEQEITGNESGVMIHPSQVPVLIEWLQEAAAEMEAGKSKTAEAS